MNIRFSPLQLFSVLGIVLTLSVFFSTHAAAEETSEANAALFVAPMPERIPANSYGCLSAVVQEQPGYI